MVSQSLETLAALYEASRAIWTVIVAYVDLRHTDWTPARIGEGRYAATIGARRMVIAATPALALCGAAVRAEVGNPPRAMPPLPRVVDAAHPDRAAVQAGQ